MADDDVTRFAELLTRLKARTDRSYASLARRAGMNASTLHRYCAGETVPLDFAVVERFATLCGASPRERVELHRLWILAAAERRRGRPAGRGAAAASGPGAERGAAEPAEPERAEPGKPEPCTAEPGVAEPGAVKHGAAEPALAECGLAGHGTAEPGAAERGAAEPASAECGLAGRGTPAHGGSPEPGNAPGSRKPPAPPTAPAPAKPPTPLATPAPSHAPAPGSLPSPPGARAWYRRRPAIVSGVLGTVFLLTAAGLSAFSSLPGLPGFAAGATAGGGARPSASPARPTAPAAPFTWTVNSHVWEGDCGHDYIIGRPPRQVPPPPSAEDAEVWADAQDAVHGGETMVRVSVQGLASTAVVLEALHVRVVRHATPPAGGAYDYDTSLGCGGGITPGSFAVSLDKRTPVPRAVPGSRGDTILPARPLPYRVSVQDPEVLLVDARTAHCACAWYLDLDWSSQGRTGTIRIDDHGRPFRTTATTGLPRYRYTGSPSHWTLEPDRP
ncbi:helix-turn-helix domain-containing protein [Streptomyces sp. f51]|uniref:helix-turn-helix domain-containing protein n=1 Tax=Streptomyces sp. f51 TaxID=1827742 RepID=UPI0030CA9912